MPVVRCGLATVSVSGSALRNCQSVQPEIYALQHIRPFVTPYPARENPKNVFASPRPLDLQVLADMCRTYTRTVSCCAQLQLLMKVTPDVDDAHFYSRRQEASNDYTRPPRCDDGMRSARLRNTASRSSRVMWHGTAPGEVLVVTEPSLNRRFLSILLP
jgi:hypothetical protein